MTELDAKAVERRFLVLTATRWAPTGLLIPLIAIVPLQRGLTLAQLGAFSAISGMVVLALELPTGGLADVIGRRPVLLAAGVCSLASTGLIAFAESLHLWMAAAFFEGVYRALESGPLEAWYVDATHDSEPEADIETGLARRGTVLSVAIGAGALASGALSLLPQPNALPLFAVPLIVSWILRAVDIVAIAVLLRERREAAAAGWNDVQASIRSTGVVVRQSIELLRLSQALIGVVAAELLWGAGIVSIELFAAPRLVELLDDAQQGAFTFAVAATIGWTVSAAGSSVAPWLAAHVGGWVNVAVITRVVQGAAVLVAGLVVNPAGLLAGYLSFYLVHGAAGVAHSGLLNRHVGAQHRTTMLSLNSFAGRVGGVTAAPLLGVAASVSGFAVVFVAGALLLAAGGPLYLLARPRNSAP